MECDGESDASEPSGSIFVLGTAFGGDDDESGGEMSDSDGGVRFVTLLPAGTVGAVGVDLAIAEQDLIVCDEPCLTPDGVDLEGLVHFSGFRSSRVDFAIIIPLWFAWRPRIWRRRELRMIDAGCSGRRWSADRLPERIWEGPKMFSSPLFVVMLAVLVTMFSLLDVLIQTAP